MHRSIRSTIAFFISHHKKIAFGIVLILLVENCVLVYNNIQNKKPILGLRVFGESVTGYTRERIQSLAKEKLEKNQRLLTLSYKDRLFQIKSSDIRAMVNYKTFVNIVLKQGRAGNVFEKILAQNKALLGLYNVPIVGELSQALLTIKILDLQHEIDRNATPPSPDFRNPQNIVPAKTGLKVQVDKLSMLIVSGIFNPPQKPLAIPTYAVFPNPHTKEDIQKLQKEIAGYSYQPIYITSGGLVFTISSESLFSMLTVTDRPDPKNPKKSILVVRFDEKKLNQSLGIFAQKVENITHAEFDDHDARVAIFSQFFSNTRRLIAIPTGRNLVNRKVLGLQTQAGQKTVYLTFDDGPNSIYHPLILDVLKTYNVKATFFFVGQNAERDSGAAKRTFAEGHVIANHSRTHSFLPNYSSNFILSELQTTNAILKPFNGNVDVLFFRPPYGGVNAYVTQTAQNLGLKMFLWDVDPKDWSEPETSDLVQRVVSSVFDTADILLHSNHLATVKALPKIIETLQAQGYTFKKLY